MRLTRKNKKKLTYSNKGNSPTRRSRTRSSVLGVSKPWLPLRRFTWPLGRLGLFGVFGRRKAGGCLRKIYFFWCFFYFICVFLSLLVFFCFEKSFIVVSLISFCSSHLAWHASILQLNASLASLWWTCVNMEASIWLTSFCLATRKCRCKRTIT